MKKLLLLTIGCILISCSSQPVGGGRNNSGLSNYEQFMRDYEAGISGQPSVPRDTSLVFSFNGPQGLSARLFYNGELINTIEPGKTIEKIISSTDNKILLKAQIGDASRDFYLAARQSSRIRINLSARRTPSGVTIVDFGIVDRIPVFDVKYVNAAALNVRDDEDSSANLVDAIPRDCRVEILEHYANNWARIKYYGNRSGYVNSGFLRSNPPTFSVTSLEIGNSTNERWLSRGEGDLYSSTMRYLSPIISYDATISGTIELYYKILNPNGSLRVTLNPDEYQIASGTNRSMNLNGWGNNSASTYPAGEYTIEIWTGNKRLWIHKFIIKP